MTGQGGTTSPSSWNSSYNKMTHMSRIMRMRMRIAMHHELRESGYVSSGEVVVHTFVAADEVSHRARDAG